VIATLLQDCNPFIRAAQIQPAILERTGLRKAYDYRLFYILENKGNVLIDDQMYPIQPDSVIILPPGTPYDFLGQLKVVVLNFDITRGFAHMTQPLFPPRVAEFDPSLLFDTQLLDGFHQPMVLHTNGCLQSSILQLTYDFNSNEQYADARSSAQLKLLFAALLSLNDDPKNRRAEQILIYIRMHAASIRSNEDVARVFGYHPVYLNDLIKGATSKTLHAVISDAKLQIACQCLTETDEPIEAIAYLAGFCSRTHFCTLFKKKLGLSPAQYRKNNAHQA
jgi:AraC-like DNA-binding protein